MEDRELLELAAKAGGYRVRWHENWQCFVHVEPHNTHNPPTMAGQRQVWVPLDDDGDALRLLVKVKPRVVEFLRNCVDIDEASEPLNSGDDNAAFRRAIVRAAADMGKGMSTPCRV